MSGRQKRRVRRPPEIRRDQLLRSAIALAAVSNYRRLTRDAIAQSCDVTSRLVNYYFRDMVSFRNEIIQTAITLRVYPVIAQGIVDDHPACWDLPLAVRQEVMRFYA